MKPQDLLESMDPLYPADFLSYQVKIGKKMTALPDLSSLLDEESFSQVELAWDLDALSGVFFIEKAVDACFFPDYNKGDAIEVFIDTRDNKQSSIVTKFCHHFLFLPEEASGVQAQEITRFRLEDSHVLCDTDAITFEVKKKKTSYELHFTLSKEILHGYDPSQSSRIGFAYRVHRYKSTPGHFPLPGRYFEPMQHPSLWASLILIG